MFRNTSIKINMMLVLSLFMGLLLVALALGWNGMRVSSQAFETLYGLSVKQVLPLKEVALAVSDSHYWMERARRIESEDGTQQDIVQAVGQAEAALSRAEQHYARFAGYAPVTETGAELGEVLARHNALMRQRAQAFLPHEAGALPVAQADLEALLAKGGALLRAFTDHAQAQIAVMQEQDSQRERWAQVVVLALMALALLISVTAWLVLRRRVLRPLDEAAQLLDRVAQGDLTSRLDVREGNEIGRLMTGLRKMQENLSQMVLQVRRGVEEIFHGSKEIAQGNADLSSRTEQQAASLQETAASMEQLASTVQQNADNARQADHLAAGSMEVARRGGEAVSEVVATMTEISSSSTKIAEIVNVIDGIAFQTNILALNAAVEASRAGDQGKGFSVVASEVRTLAQRSAQAAKEIKQLIDDSVNKVKAGSDQVGRAGDTMREIMESVQRVADIMGEISSASQEQSLGIDQINRAVAQMDQVTQQNAALVEQAAAAAGSLEDQASSLAQAVSAFKVSSGGASRARTAAGSTGSHAVASGGAAQASARLAAATRSGASAAASSASATSASARKVAKPAVAGRREPVAVSSPASARAARAGDEDDWESF